jgi:O-antigen ligase
MTLERALTVAAQASLALVFLAFPMSVALANVGLLLMLAFWLPTLAWPGARSRLHEAMRNPLAVCAVALFAWILLASAWSPAQNRDILGFWQKYLKFLMVPVFIALMHDEAVRRRCWQGFALALLITLTISWLDVFLDFPWTRGHRMGLASDHTVFKDYISQGLMMTLFTTICAFTVVTSASRVKQAMAMALWVLAAISIVALSHGRTGYLTLAAATVVFGLTFVASRSRMQAWSISAGLLVLILMTWWLSPVLHERLVNAWTDAMAALAQSGLGNVTSAGARVEMIKLALSAAGEAPFFGQGTAAYPVLASKYFSTVEWCSVTCPHPHNQFLFFLVEQGLTGLSLFLAYLAVIGRTALRQPPAHKAFTLAFVAVAVVAASTHSAFWLSTESHCLILMSALIMAGLRARRAAGAPT